MIVFGLFAYVPLTFVHHTYVCRGYSSRDYHFMLVAFFIRIHLHISKISFKLAKVDSLFKPLRTKVLARRKIQQYTQQDSNIKCV